MQNHLGGIYIFIYACEYIYCFIDWQKPLNDHKHRKKHWWPLILWVSHMYACLHAFMHACMHIIISSIASFRDDHKFFYSSPFEIYCTLDWSPGVAFKKGGFLYVKKMPQKKIR